MNETLATKADLPELEARIDARFDAMSRQILELERRMELRLSERLADLERRMTVRMLAGIAAVSALARVL